ncbi:MAG: four helix bundle protein, partial [Waterburya sp.]
RYQAAFIAKLSDAEAEAAEVQVWLKFAVECSYLKIDIARNLYQNYNRIIGSLVNMMNNSDKWIL